MEDCKSSQAGSIPALPSNSFTRPWYIGGASAFQAEEDGFDSRRSLQEIEKHRMSKNLIEEAVRIMNDSKSSEFQKGDKVIIKNPRKYDSMASSTPQKGIVDFVWKDGRVAVTVKTQFGQGQSNVDPEDLELQ